MERILWHTLNHPEVTQCSDLDTLAVEAIPDPEICLDAPVLEEVCSAIKKLQSKRTAVSDSKASKHLKGTIELINVALHQHFVQAWTTGKVPVEWKEGTIIPLNKGKRPCIECSSYRPVTLLYVPEKVLRDVLLTDSCLSLWNVISQSNHVSLLRELQWTLYLLAVFYLKAIVNSAFDSSIHRPKGSFRFCG